MTSIIWIMIKPIIEISILCVAFYRILVFFAGTRAFQVLRGIIYLVVAFLLSQILGFTTLNWLLTKLFGISIIALLIIFQQELRHGLARLGQQHLFTVTLEESELLALIEEIISATVKLSLSKIGALMAIERETKLEIYIESGVKIDSELTSELLQSIFLPPSPLHDGGVIIRGKRIAAASCLFPLSENPNLNKILGTRHRAALGISEQTDAIVILISEETGEISVAMEGRFIPVINKERFHALLKELLMKPKKRRQPNS